MISRTKPFLLLIALIYCSCSVQQRYYDSLVPDSRMKVRNNPFGSYIELKTGAETITGELISISEDTTYVMTYDGMIQKANSEITTFEIHLTQNKAKKYGQRTLIGTIPALLGALIHLEYAGGFLLLAVAIAATGGLAALFESARIPTIITGPENNLDLSEYWKYARFPAGLPENLDPANLPVPAEKDEM